MITYFFLIPKWSIKHSITPWINKIDERISVYSSCRLSCHFKWWRFLTNQIKQQIVEAEEKGKAEGKVEGKVEENIRVKIEIAKNLLSQNIDINTISTATGLSIAKIEKLKD